MIPSGILKAVPPDGSKWVSPIVVMAKPSGDFLICADYKVSVNRRICCDSHPMPSMETIFSELANMKVYARLDLTNDYNQIQMDKDPQEITNMNTLIPFGIENVSAQFQEAMEKSIDNAVENMVIYQDDICIGAKSETELDMKIKVIMARKFGHEYQSRKVYFQGH